MDVDGDVLVAQLVELLEVRVQLDFNASVKFGSVIELDSSTSKKFSRLLHCMLDPR